MDIRGDDIVSSDSDQEVSPLRAMASEDRRQTAVLHIARAILLHAAKLRVLFRQFLRPMDPQPPPSAPEEPPAGDLPSGEASARAPRCDGARCRERIRAGGHAAVATTKARRGPGAPNRCRHCRTVELQESAVAGLRALSSERVPPQGCLPARSLLFPSSPALPPTHGDVRQLYLSRSFRDPGEAHACHALCMLRVPHREGPASSPPQAPGPGEATTVVPAPRVLGGSESPAADTVHVSLEQPDPSAPGSAAQRMGEQSPVPAADGSLPPPSTVAGQEPFPAGLPLAPPPPRAPRRRRPGGAHWAALPLVSVQRGVRHPPSAPTWRPPTQRRYRKPGGPWRPWSLTRSPINRLRISRWRRLWSPRWWVPVRVAASWASAPTDGAPAEPG